MRRACCGWRELTSKFLEEREECTARAAKMQEALRNRVQHRNRVAAARAEGAGDEGEGAHR